MKVAKFIKHFICFIILIWAIGINAQENPRIKKKQFKTKIEGYKVAWQNIKKGNKLYNFGGATYRDAREYYLKAYKYNEKNAELNYKIGICYLFADDKFEAIKYLKKAYEIKPKVTDDIRLQLARAYHMSLDFTNAQKEYKAFKIISSERKLNKLGINIDNLITQCDVGKSLVSHPLRVVIANLGTNINTKFDDYNSVIDIKDDNMYFTSRRSSKDKSRRSPIDQKFYEDIYLSRKKGNDWGNATLIEKFKTRKNEAVVSISPDGQKLYIYKGRKNGSIYESKFKKGKWRGLSPLRKINTNVGRETSMSLSTDGKKLYFITDYEWKNHVGGKDIYVSNQKKNGKWSKPVNLGSIINSTGNEETVNISRDGKTLYFSSKGHPSMGGYDIFKSTLSDNGKWTIPQNIGYPVNTPDDDLFFSLQENGKFGYLTSNREAGLGGKDIYKVIFLGSEKEILLATETSNSLFFKENATVFVKNVMPVTIDTSVYMKGLIIDADTKEPILAKLNVIDSDKGIILTTLLSGTDGTYSAKLPEKKLYGIEITAKGYLFYLDVIDLKKEPGDVINKNFELNKLEVGAKVVLKNIFFEVGKAALLAESNQQLDNVFMFLKDNPTVRLEVSGHTDNVGSRNSNMKLSQNRAKSVADYLINKGIEKARLEYVGYGPDQPLGDNKTPEGKAQNRRVEFKIIGK